MNHHGYLLSQADARRLPLADGCVQCCVTSPPYWGLRDYRVPGQIGLEATPDEFVAAMVGVFREVRRVLRDDGVLFLNLGDSYANDTKWGGSGGGPTTKNYTSGLGGCVGQKAKRNTGLKPKDLVGIPWRVAFALQADGWYLRSDIIWDKPNPMPESVTDRPTKAHEYVFLMAKSERYFWDAEAVKQPMAESSAGRYAYQFGGAKGIAMAEADKIGIGRRTTPIGHREATGGANVRTVWRIATQPYSGAHFATYPEELPRRCIKAGSRPGDLVLDPFNGSGTTGAVARQLERCYVGFDLSREYLGLAVDRIGGALKPKSRLDDGPAAVPLPGQLSLFGDAS